MAKAELLPSYSTVALIEEPTQLEDPWDLPELRDTGIKWSGKLQATGPQEGTCLVCTVTLLGSLSPFIVLPP